jgi:hypothetical protein
MERFDCGNELWFRAVDELSRFHAGETSFYGRKMDETLPTSLIDLLQRSKCK